MNTDKTRLTVEQRRRAVELEQQISFGSVYDAAAEIIWLRDKLARMHPDISTLARSDPKRQSAEVCYCHCDDGDPAACRGWRDEQDEPPCRCICHQPEIPARVMAAVTAISSEPVYESGDMRKGVSPRFLMRITLLRDACGLADAEQPMVEEALAVLASS